MTGFITDFVNQIANNLRDRYKTGFPVLKELVQNADDAGARNLVFGYHPGFGDHADHRLLKGPGLWVFNDGGFTQTDKQAIRSFGFNAKAGDAGAIGKFGLGMKSVFHLCECFMYVAKKEDGELEHDVLNPWATGSEFSTPIHKQWEDFGQNDIGKIKSVVEQQPEADEAASWFMLWVPLRSRKHVPISKEHNNAALTIIERYPGDNPEQDLDFFSDPKIEQEIGSLLPLLRHLESIRFAGAFSRPSFSVQLKLDGGSNRLTHTAESLKASGVVIDSDLKAKQLSFYVQQNALTAEPVFVELQETDSWPTSMSMTEQGRRSVKDKAIAEATVMFAHAKERSGKLTIQWALFLPTGEEWFTYEHRIPQSSIDYHIVLHGQFFVDAGRRGIAEMKALHLKPESVDLKGLSQSDLMKRWNQELTQRVVLPLLIPTLLGYVEKKGLRDNEIRALVQAIADCKVVDNSSPQANFFNAFKDYICKEQAWVRRLSQKGASWEAIDTVAHHVFKLPSPPSSDSERPWRVFPTLRKFENWVLIDADAPMLASNMNTDWQEDNLKRLFNELNTNELKQQTGLSYFAEFIKQEASRFLSTDNIRSVLISRLREFYATNGLEVIRQHRELHKQILHSLGPENVFAIGTIDTKAQTALPDWLFKKIIGQEASVLLVPLDLKPEWEAEASSKPSEHNLKLWLEALANIVKDSKNDHTKIKSVTTAAEQIIELIKKEDRSTFLKRFATLPILNATNIRINANVAISLRDLAQTAQEKRLFKTIFDRRGSHLPALLQALPNMDLLVTQATASGYVESYCDDIKISAENDATAVFMSIGYSEQAPELGSVKARQQILELVNKATLQDKCVIRGIRYLLHGKPEYYKNSDNLWKSPGTRQNEWVRLWKMIDNEPWKILDNALCGSLSANAESAIGISSVERQNVIDKLHQYESFDGVNATELSKEEITEILANVDRRDSWRRLPLHETVDGRWVAITDQCYLGSKPDLPDGLNAAISFIAPSLNAAVKEHQKRDISEWNAKAAADIVLSSESPEKYWRYLLNLLAEDKTLGEQLPEKWKTVKWLVLQSGKLISLDDLIDIPDLNAEIGELIEKCDYIYATPDYLCAEIKEHTAFKLLREGFNQQEAALQTLGLLMNEAKLSIGACAAKNFSSLFKYKDTLRQLKTIPAWRLLIKATEVLSDESIEQNLVPKLNHSFNLEKATSVLQELNRHKVSEAIRVIFNCYLNEWRASSSSEHLQEMLAEFNLISEADTWEHSAELTVGLEGVVTESVLSAGQESILAAIIETNTSQKALSESDEVIEENSDIPIERALEEYFVELTASSVRKETGALMGVFGSKVRELAEHWLDPIGYEDYLKMLNWEPPKVAHDGRREWMFGKTITEALDTLTVRLYVEEAQRVNAISLLGASVPVQLMSADQLGTLFVKTDKWHADSCRVVLRPVQFMLERPLKEQRDILIRTAEQVFKSLYSEKNANLQRFITLSEEGGQLSLDIAKDMIVNSFPSLLSTMSNSISNNEILKKLKQNYDQAQRDFSSAKKFSGDIEASQNNLDNALCALVSKVESSEEVQQVLLEGLRKRISDNQYELSSIPFEVFQNADDAVLQLQNLQKLEKRPEYTSDQIGRFVMRSVSENTLCFLHWGRPINYAGSKRHDEFELTYGSDLENMLQYGGTAKSYESGDTGKFGLGFKSILLASSTPRVLSGDLSFQIVAGCLPVEWKASEETKQLYKAVVEGSQKSLRETLIELPLDEEVKADEVSSRFEQQAGMLALFGKQINRIGFNHSVYHWQPKQVLNTEGNEPIEGLEIGDAYIPHKETSTKAALLRIKVKQGTLVLRLERNGFQLFDQTARHALPAFWVTAPTRGKEARGVVVNAGFIIDTGRASLANTSAAKTHNEKLIRDLAKSAAVPLTELYQRAISAWDELRRDLKLQENLTNAEFLLSFWSAVLGPEVVDTDAFEAELLSNLGKEVLKRVLAKINRLPNGFEGKASGFISPDKADLFIKKKLVTEGFFAELSEWSRFTDKHSDKNIYTEPVNRWLRVLGVSDDSQKTLELADILACLPEGKLAADEVESLSKLLQSWTKMEGSWSLRNLLSEHLGNLLFLAKNGEWKTPIQLIDIFHPENAFFIKFAPVSELLDEKYGSVQGALVFLKNFFQYKKPLSSEIAEWCLAANGKARHRVIKYLVHDFPSDVLFDLRKARSSNSWIFDLTVNSKELSEVKISERELLLERLGLKDSEAASDNSYSFHDWNLQSVYDWWAERGDKWLAQYDASSWPAEFDKKALLNEEVDRTAWMTLFALGALRSFGRTTEQQHKGFVEYLNSKGWWDTICRVKPEAGKEAWIDILRDYSEQKQIDSEYELWMDSFPRLHRLACWLETYVHIFRTLDRRDETSLVNFLSPGADASLSGSGIDAPTLGRVLRMGQHFVVRELLRVGVLKQDTAIEYLAFSPRQAVKDLLDELGCYDCNDSQSIYNFIVEEIGEERARFNGAYDIPLQLIASVSSKERADFEEWLTT